VEGGGPGGPLASWGGLLTCCAEPLAPSTALAAWSQSRLNDARGDVFALMPSVACAALLHYGQQPTCLQRIQLLCMCVVSPQLGSGPCGTCDAHTRCSAT
jgi:hypothetical protein